MDKIPLPKEFLSHPGNPVLPFRHWIEMFNNYIFLKDTKKDMSDETKNRLLLPLLGLEGIRIFSSNPMCGKVSTAKHSDFQKALNDIFNVKINPFKAHFDFEGRNQHPSETTQEYVTALRSLMADCDFKGHDSHHLAIRLVNGCHNRDTQKKLLVLPEVKLETVVELMQAEETANLSATAISRAAAAAAVPASPVHRVDKPPSKHQHKVNKACTNCGRAGHKPGDASCPARGKACNNCGKTGHFATKCRSKKVKTVVKAVSSPKYSFTIQLKVGERTVPLTAQVDTGASITGVTESFFKQHYPRHQRRLLPATTLFNFDGSPLKSPAKGRFTAVIEHHGRQHQAELHVLPDTCDACIGQDVIQLLGLQIDGAREQVRSVTTPILQEFPKLHDPEMGTYPDYEHVIVTEQDARPVAQKLRPVPLARRQQAADEIQSMDAAGIWEPVDRSQWVHHMVTVRKPQGGLRITTDLSPLNRYVVPDRFPLPNPRELFLELKGATVFSKLDLRKAFFHIKLAQESRELTTTLTHQGLRQYTRLPMGLKDSASVCQRLVSQTLAGCPGTIAYIDDILVFGSTQEEHDACLREALKRLEAKDFRLQTSKCAISVPEVTFLGHVISASGIRPDPKNVEPIQKAPRPTTVKQVASFLGMVNYYQEFIPNMATLAEPLRRLQRKGVKFAWSQSCQAAFDRLKAAISRGVKVFIFDPNAPTYVSVDASDVGVGAVLSQIQNGKEVPIAHASHTLQERERAYAVNEREALACVWACETWEKFLLGRSFVLRTDHASLVSLLQSTTDTRKSAKFSRWLERLSEFDYKVEYRQGSQNAVADALSRLSVPSTGDAVADPTHDAIVRALTSDNLSPAAIKQATRADSTLSLVTRYVSQGWPKKVTSPGLTSYKHVKDELAVQDGYLLRGERIVVPAVIQRRLLEAAHVGHPGIVRMKRQLRRAYWWPGQDKAVEEFVRRCSACQQSDKSVAPANVPTAKVPTPAKPWQKLAIDIAGPFAVAPMNERFVVVLMDQYSKYPEILVTGNITSEAIIRWLDDIFSRYGLPNEIHSDNGKQFVSHDMARYLAANNVKHTRTPVYCPQQNGLVERFNRYVKTHVEAFVADNTPWRAGINALLRNFRATPSSADGKSPAEIMFGRSMRLPHEMPPCDLHTSPVPPPVNPENPANLKCRGPYKVADMVMVRRPHVPKGQCAWSRPIRVVEVLGNFAYRLSDGQVWNARKMRRYIEPDIAWDDAAPAPAAAAAAAPGSQAAPVPAPRRSARDNRGVPPLRYPH